MYLVSRCSDTLESLSDHCYVPGALPSVSTSSQSLTTRGRRHVWDAPLDLSKARKLKDLLFWFGGLDVQRITMTLQTAQSKHLQQITIYPRGSFANPVEETVRRGWQDLDRLLVQFWTSHSIRPKITYDAGKGQDDWGVSAPMFVPELTRRGIVDLVANRCRYMEEE